GPHVRALDLLLAQEVDAVQLHHLPDGDHPDDGGRAAGTQHLEGLLGGDLQADGLEGVVHAHTTGELAHLGDRIFRRVHQVGGAELLGQLQLGVDHVDCDDAGGPGDERPLDAVEADATGADDGDGRSRL